MRISRPLKRLLIRENNIIVDEKCSTENYNNYFYYTAPDFLWKWFDYHTGAYRCINYSETVQDIINHLTGVISDGFSNETPIGNNNDNSNNNCNRTMKNENVNNTLRLTDGFFVIGQELAESSFINTTLCLYSNNQMLMVSRIYFWIIIVFAVLRIMYGFVRRCQNE